MENNKYLIPLSVVIAGALIAGAIYYGGRTPSGSRVAPSDPVEEEVKIASITERDHIIGSRNAEVVVIEYSDFECPFCKVFHATMQNVVESYEGRVAWVYRHYPIVQLHSKAFKESEASECAWEQDGHEGFWRFTDKLFETTNSNDSLDLSELPRIAEAVGLNVESFNSCLSERRYQEYIENSVKAAIEAGARGTPYSIAISRSGEQIPINGAEPLSLVKAKIDSLIEN